MGLSQRLLAGASWAGFSLLMACSSNDGTAGPSAAVGSGGNSNLGGSSSGGAKSGGMSSGGAATGGKSTGGADAAGGKSTGGADAAGGSSQATGGALSAMGGSSQGAAPEPGLLAGITAAHNEVRAAANPAPAVPLVPLVWDAAIFAVAQSWADGCHFMHSQSQYGENIYARTGNSVITSKDVVNSWASESPNYSYANNTCAANQQCGHYTQIVWAGSKKLGCGVTSCSQNSPFQGSSNWEFWVCNYDPPGNYNAAKPY